VNHPAFLWARLLPDRAVIAWATCGPVGRWGKAPGTNGTVLGLLLYTAVFYRLGIIGELLLTAVLVFLAVGICGEAERRMGKRDPGEVILDEVVAVPLCFVGMAPVMASTGHVWAYMLAGFALFRFFDILKPLGIARLQNYPGGLGVVADDIAAAIAASAVLRLGLLALLYLL